jgi:uncharacterized protein involved in type VI secretion and phage assembly
MPAPTTGSTAPALPSAPDRALEDLLEHLRTRFYGKYRGIVAENEDPAEMGRIKARIPSVLGTVESGWCTPCVPYAGPQVGIAFLPAVGSGVWIEFEGGDVSFPIWVGGYWRKGELPTDASPEVKVIVTSAPLEVKLDDSAQALTMTDPSGNIAALEDAGIKLSNGGQQLVIDEASVSVNEGALEVM